MAIPLSEYRPYRFVKLPAPVLVTEADGDVQIVTLSDTLSAGIYDITISLVSAFSQAGDQLEWFATGAIASPRFLIEAKAATEDIPTSYTFPFEHAGGVLDGTLFVAITGAGTADVTIQAANIIFNKKAE